MDGRGGGPYRSGTSDLRHRSRRFPDGLGRSSPVRAATRCPPAHLSTMDVARDQLPGVRPIPSGTVWTTIDGPTAPVATVIRRISFAPESTTQAVAPSVVNATAYGPAPVGISAPTVLVAVVTGSTPPLPAVTYSSAPSGETAIPAGDVPSGTVAVSVPVAPSTTESALPPVSLTYTVPDGVTL